jgi:hypothetical protein
MFALCLRSYMFTQVGICLRSVYAVFTQCLRMFTQICFCLRNVVICVNIAAFFACLRMFTHVYAYSA